MTRPAPQLTPDHFKDATALCRATLAHDDDGLLAIAQSCDVVMTFQALVHMHLAALLGMAGTPEAVDAHLVNYAESITRLEGLL